MFMTQMRSTLVILRDRLVVCHAGADVAHKKCKSTSHQPSLWARSFKSGASLAVRVISKFPLFCFNINLTFRVQNYERDLFFVLSGRNLCGVEKIRLFNGSVSKLLCF